MEPKQKFLVDCQLVQTLLPPDSSKSFSVSERPTISDLQARDDTHPLDSCHDHCDFEFDDFTVDSSKFVQDAPLFSHDVDLQDGFTVVGQGRSFSRTCATAQCEASSLEVAHAKYFPCDFDTHDFADIAGEYDCLDFNAGKIPCEHFELTECGNHVSTSSDSATVSSTSSSSQVADEDVADYFALYGDECGLLSSLHADSNFGVSAGEAGERRSGETEEKSDVESTSSSDSENVPELVLSSDSELESCSETSSECSDSDNVFDSDCSSCKCSVFDNQE